ncbi:DUF3427 domain-containing protein [Ottowia sp. GY511]|uniref:DUF3427 domain-containing protein n=1 Tax=Ottowia flava TaxID=2675430 RepID=A0ABW4KR59_9BURK|nr:DUF3427 domain-containing protein [Ottowia sp. GY511]TXK27785.1 DUF3427 domain-containing protein [Ottowia sp. GY511]
MSQVTFASIIVGQTYSRETLAKLWDYSSFHAIARGVVTPAQDDKIILFVTEHKQNSAEPYQDALTGDRLEWEGPTDHFGEQRILGARESGDQIHLFHRAQHRMQFTYLGKLTLVSQQLFSDRPSRFVFALP